MQSYFLPSRKFYTPTFNFWNFKPSMNMQITVGITRSTRSLLQEPEIMMATMIQTIAKYERDSSCNSGLMEAFQFSNDKQSTFLPNNQILLVDFLEENKSRIKVMQNTKLQPHTWRFAHSSYLIAIKCKIISEIFHIFWTLRRLGHSFQGEVLIILTAGHIWVHRAWQTLLAPSTAL